MRDFEAIHEEILVFDTHCDTVSRVLKDGIDLGVRSEKGHIDIPRLKEGGVDAQIFACCVTQQNQPDGYYLKRILRMIDALYLQFEKNSDSIKLSLTAEDVRKAKQDGKIAAVIAVETGQAIEDDLAFLRDYYRLGVRVMTLVWNSTNWADSFKDEPIHNGLTDFGRDVVREMNRLGMMIDVSHSSDKTVWDTLETSNAPIIASHSCAKAICDHGRNLNDDLIKAISDGGGVICVNFYSQFLDQEYKNKRAEGLKPSPPPLSKVIDHIDYIAGVGGIDSVGLGSDFDGMNPPPVGLEDVTKMPRITEALLERGYSVAEIRKISGGNFMRVFEQVCGI